MSPANSQSVLLQMGDYNALRQAFPQRLGEVTKVHEQTQTSLFEFYSKENPPKRVNLYSCTYNGPEKAMCFTININICQPKDGTSKVSPAHSKENPVPAALASAGQSDLSNSKVPSCSEVGLISEFSDDKHLQPVTDSLKGKTVPASASGVVSVLSDYKTSEVELVSDFNDDAFWSMWDSQIKKSAQSSVNGGGSVLSEYKTDSHSGVGLASGFSDGHLWPVKDGLKEKQSPPLASGREAALSQLKISTTPDVIDITSVDVKENANPPEEVSESTACCSVCLDNEPECVIKCGHVFCETCLVALRRYKKLKCPICKKVFRNWGTVHFAQE